MLHGKSYHTLFANSLFEYEFNRNRCIVLQAIYVLEHVCKFAFHTTKWLILIIDTFIR